jgi:deoxyribonuclease-4
MRYIGAHVSSEKGIHNAPKNAQRINANAFAFFTKNQRRWESKPYSDEEINKFKQNLKESGILKDKIVPHSSYLINICSPDKEKRKKSLDALLDETLRVEQLDLIYLNFHPGSHLGLISENDAIKIIAEGVNYIIENSLNCILLLETTSGQGSNIGYKFEQLRDIIGYIKNQERVGICIDTCHIFAAGYDIRTGDNYNKTFEDFEKIIGLEKLKAIHLNDSKYDLDSKKDRHENIGKGFLNIETFKLFINDIRFKDLPFILETPDETKWEEEINLLRSLENNF